MKRFLFILLSILPLTLPAQEDSTRNAETDLQQVQVQAFALRRGRGIENKELMGQADFVRAACCNLGESFINNAAVDVSYADAATGAAQIRLLGLSGSYVQMMTENIPNYRGAAMPYALGYVPGPWMQSIQISKGASSVKNGYESVTGQINIEFLKPQGEQSFHANAYLNQHLEHEVNIDANTHLPNDCWSVGLLTHYNGYVDGHDANNDGFMDKAMNRQFNVLNRWAYFSPKYIMQAQIKGLWERRMGGEMEETPLHPHYKIGTTTNRYEFHVKNAYIFNAEKNGNVALILSGRLHDYSAYFGNRAHRRYDVKQHNLYASLMFEEDFSAQHSLSAGLSMQGDWMDENLSTSYHEVVPGAYAQYTFTPLEQLTLMAGMRLDHSNLWGTFFTPRFHLRYAPTDWFTMRASAGKGYRTAHVWAENTFLLASSRQLKVEGNLPQEEAWNMGTSLQFAFPLAGRKMEFNVDYYYTTFLQQVLTNRDRSAHEVIFQALNGSSYSHCLQLEATYHPFRGFTTTAAWRLNHVRATIDGRLRELPLTSRYKGLLSLSYRTPLELWQFDLTCQLNGPGRLPDPDSKAPLWDKTFPAYPQLSAQVSRFFRHVDVYVGAENITNFRQHLLVVDAPNPWSSDFDATNIWGPVDPWKVYVGVRVKL